MPDEKSADRKAAVKHLVDCDEHGPGRLGYVVCLHVGLRGATPLHFFPATENEAGELLCRECMAFMLAPHTLESAMSRVSLCCDQHAKKWIDKYDEWARRIN